MIKLQTEILKVLSYFDIFNHPLKIEEVINLSLESKDKQAFEKVLSSLVSENKCFYSNGFYSIQNDVDKLISSRQSKEQEAQKYFTKLPVYVKLIRSFPFVRGIAVSGSLSKNVMHDDGDIDYFIITALGRLWICRTFLILFKKVFLLNSRKYFCVNYFVDEDNLKIIDQNVFTAMEITYLAPVYNKFLIDQLKTKNNWTESYFSNFDHSLQVNISEKKSFLKPILEFILKGKIGDYIDLFLMKLTYKRWSQKFKDFDPEKFELTMRTNRGVSKHHPLDFQNKVLKEFNARLKKLKIS